MILEVVTAHIKPGQNQAFETAFRQAAQIIARAKGHISHELRKCMEVENKYVFLVQWETLDDHMVAFRQSPAYQDFRALVYPFYESPPTVEHYTRVPLD